MERYQPSLLVDIRQQRRDVAGADKNLRLAPDEIQIEPRQQVVATVPTPGAEDGLHVIALPHLVELAHAPLDRAREINITIEDIVSVYDVVPEPLQLRAARLEHGAVEGAGRRDHADGVALAQSSRPNQWGSGHD